MSPSANWEVELKNFKKGEGSGIWRLRQKQRPWRTWNPSGIFKGNLQSLKINTGVSYLEEIVSLILAEKIQLESTDFVCLKLVSEL